MSLHNDIKYLRLASSRLRNFKQKSDSLFCCSCPFCGDSKKNKLKARFYVFPKVNSLYGKCHNCGICVSIPTLLAQVDPTLHKEYILERYTSGETGKGKTPTKAKKFNIPTPKFDKVEKQKAFDYGEWCSTLDESNICYQYLKSRNIPIDFWGKLLYTDNYKKFVDNLIPNHGKKLTEDKRLVIPFYDENGVMIAVSGRSLEESSTYKLRYVTVRTAESQDKLIYGLDRVDKNKLIKIVEGPIDSIFLNNCIASGDSSLSTIAKQLGLSNVVLIWDAEPRNKEIVNMMAAAIKDGYSIVIWPNNTTEKDINEMINSGKSVEDIEKIISENTYSGLEALAKFTFWKKV